MLKYQSYQPNHDGHEDDAHDQGDGQENGFVFSHVGLCLSLLRIYKMCA